MTMPDSVADSFPSRISLSGQGLHLREWADEDLPVMVELFDEAQIIRWTPLRSPFDLDAAREYLTGARKARAAGSGIQLAISSDGTNAQGEILLFRTAEKGREAELAYAIGAEHRRQGLASRAVRLMTGYAYDTLKMTSVLLRIDPANEASIAVARATGFHLSNDEPVIRQRVDRSVTLLTWRHRRALG